MTELQVGHTAFPKQHYYEESDGDAWAVFLLPVKGEAQVRAAGCTLNVKQGELAFLPEGVRCQTLWNAEREIEFFSFRIISRQYDTQNIERFAMQKVPVPPEKRPETESVFREIYRLFSTGERISRVRAIGLYYGFYAQVLPLLSAEEPVRFHPAVVNALAYIDAHYTQDFGMDTLAQEVCVSESRLFHLFKKQLATTPVRYRNEMRVIRASRALRLTEDPIEAVAAENGFHSAIYFREIFKEITGLTPSEYRQSVHGGR